MSKGYPFQSAPAPAGLTGLPAVPPPGSVRHPLGLPRGSVRAVLAFMVLGTVWTLLLIPAEKIPNGIPPYLFYLTFLILGSYFGARSSMPHVKGGEPHPLFLPRGSIRALIIIGFIAACGLGYHHDREFFYRIKLGHASSQPLLPFLLFGGFFLGAAVNWIAGLLLKRPTGMPVSGIRTCWVWVSVLAVFGLAFEVIYQLVVVPASASSSELPQWQGILAAIVAFYFRART